MVTREKLGYEPRHLSVSPRANAYLIEDEQHQLHFWHIDNEHPEVSWKAIWGKVWYESREQPEYIWQSSSASSDFEPKFSLTPLAFGTLKAAFYAMLFAIPMSICGAIYTAYFMSPKMRGIVKPTIEIMEALPTVILGFLAGLWFAPFVEKHMPGMFLLLFLLPMSILIAAYLWERLPEIHSPVDTRRLGSGPFDSGVDDCDWIIDALQPTAGSGLVWWQHAVLDYRTSGAGL